MIQQDCILGHKKIPLDSNGIHLIQIFNSNEVGIEQSFELIASCIDKIYSEDEIWATADVSRKETIEFLEQMNSTQFKLIEEFFETMPKLCHTLKVKNPKTKVTSEVVLEGLNSFFA